MARALLPFLSGTEIKQIHYRSLDLLERVGIDYRTPCALKILEKLGCRVDYDRTWASLPREVVRWALEQAPRTVCLAARDPTHDVILDGRRSHHTTDSQGTQAIDLESGQQRPSTQEDLRRGLLLADALDKIDIVNVLVAANDVPAHVRTVRHFALAFTWTGKHVRSGVLHAAQVPFLVELAKAVSQDHSFRPIFSAVECTISPLMHDGPMTEACIELARLGVPIMVYPMPLAGGTAPVTLAGTILLHNAEFLSGLVLFQAVNPGAAILYGTGAARLDMHTGHYRSDTAGYGLQLGLCQMAQFYNLPVNLGGLATSSDQLGALYGHQATATCLLAYLAGADEIYSMGLLNSAQVLSLDKLVLDNHLAQQIEEMLRPVVVDEEHLQAELIERVGIGGHFLKHRETRAFTRQEYVPVWPPTGRNILDMAHQEALQILHHHHPPPLPAGAQDSIEAVLTEAERALAGHNHST